MTSALAARGSFAGILRVDMSIQVMMFFQMAAQFAVLRRHFSHLFIPFQGR
ncbi:MAG: hypothetical protein ACM4D3_09245 [Candidatus Sericytochromatia bacterium]